MKKGFISLCLLACIALMAQGCATTPVQQGAVSGAAVGAVAGQVIGKNREATAIGAGVGALGGALFNDKYKVQKRN